jgi:PAS domain S-box-containing protein
MDELINSHTDQLVCGIVEASPVPLIISRVSDGRILYANEPLAALVGLRAGELIGRSTLEFYADPGDRKIVLDRLKKDSHLRNQEIRLKKADGVVIWVLLSVVAMELGGEPVIVGGVYDISERKRMEEALRQSEARFRGIVENANDTIFSMTPEGIFTYISPNFKDFTGYDPEEFLGKSFVPLVHPDDLEGCRAFIRQVLETGVSMGSREYRVRRKDGRLKWHATDGSVVRDERGNVVSIIGVSHDVTERRQILDELQSAYRHLRETQAQLVQSEKMASLGNLVAGIAHEINTPVGAIHSMHDTLARAVERLQTLLDAQFPKALQENRELQGILKIISDASRVIETGSERVTDIVRSLRSFARLDEAEMKRVDLHEGIEDTLTLIHHDLKNRIRVVKNYGDIPPIVCYPSRLNQVFLNLLVNAKQAIRGAGEITVTTLQKDDRVHISFRDTGAGIPEGNLSRIFDPGFTTKGVGVGTGLGLSICYRIVQDHKGEIRVESRVGEGSTFTVILPVNLDKTAGHQARST